MKRKKDKYDVAIAYLRKHPENIYAAWHMPHTVQAPKVKQAHCLFQVTAPFMGCLTQIRHRIDDGMASSMAPTPELTKAIRADKRIPKDPHGLTVKSLPVFAQWQRKLDKILKRK